MLVQEYDRFYTDNPEKWNSTSQDAMRFEFVRQYGPPKTLLDVGCGNGHTLAYFAQQWPDTQYAGIDLSSVAVTLAKKRIPFAKIICGDVLAMGRMARDGIHEMILLAGVAEHFPDPLDGLERVCGLLAHDGITYLEMPNCLAYPNAGKEEGYRRPNIGSKQMEWHLNRMSWVKLIGKAGLRILEGHKGSNAANEFIWIVGR